MRVEAVSSSGNVKLHPIRFTTTTADEWVTGEDFKRRLVEYLSRRAG
jgi:hypothetical protein